MYNNINRCGANLSKKTIICGSQGSTGPSGSTGTSGPTGPTGPIGPKGQPGQSSSFYNYLASSNTINPDPANGYIQWQNEVQSDSQHISVSAFDILGNDVEVLLGSLNVGDLILLQDKNNSNNYQ